MVPDEGVFGFTVPLLERTIRASEAMLPLSIETHFAGLFIASQFSGPTQAAMASEDKSARSDLYPHL